MSTTFRDKDKEQVENDFDAGFKIPSIKKALGGIDEAVQRKDKVFMEHQAQNEKEEQEGKQRPKRKPKRGGQICFCGNPVCTIGEMVELKD